MDLPDIDLDELLLQSLKLLEWRLEILEFVLDGNVKKSNDSAKLPVTERLEKLERSLEKLASKSPVVTEVMQLHAHHPDLFKRSPNPSTPSSLAPASQLATVLAAAPTYPSTASQLTTLNDTPVPSTDTYTSLLTLQPRIVELQYRQFKQAMEISELRKRSAIARLRWGELFGQGVNECWREWMGRIARVEREVRREEVRRRREEEGG